MTNFSEGKVKIIDTIIILGVFLALVVGFFTYKHFRQTASKQVERTAKIGFQVFLRGVTLTGGVMPMKVGDNTFISIRNVPYTDLKIVDVKADTKKVVVPNPKGTPAYTLVDDYSQIFMYDIVVTVVDMAQITKDGPVVGGNKIKIGLPITLEGPEYKLNGTVSNLQILPDAPAKSVAPASAGAPQPQSQTQPQPSVAGPSAPQVNVPAPTVKSQPQPQPVGSASVNSIKK